MKKKLAEDELARELRKMMRDDPDIARIIDDPWGYCIDKCMAEGMTLEEAEAVYKRDCEIAMGIANMEEKLGRAVSKEEYLRARKH